MKNGAFGMSTGLSPGLREFASDEEMIECGKVVQKYGGIWSTHTRWQEHDWFRTDPKDIGYGTNYAPPGEAIAGRFHGIAESVELSGKADNITHLIGHLNPGYLAPMPHPEYLDAAVARATIDMIIEPARKKGRRIFHSVIVASGYQNAGPGPGSQSSILDTFQLGIFVKDFEKNPRVGGLKIHATPDWLKKMTKEEFLAQLKTKEFREKLKKVIYTGKMKFKYVHPVQDPYWMDCFRVLTHKNPAYVGRTIGEIARERSPDNIKKAVYEESFNALFDIVVEDPEATWADILDKRELSGAQCEFLKYPTGNAVHRQRHGPRRGPEPRAERAAQAIWDIPALHRYVRQEIQGSDPGGGHQQSHVRSGPGAHGPEGPGGRPPGGLCRSGRFQFRHDPDRRGLREAERAARRDRVCVRQRPLGLQG